jgi:tetratricopeptide (TPR) repeat protein
MYSESVTYALGKGGPLSALLKGFGLTIWGAIGVGLLIIAVFIGYQAALKFRNANVPAVNDSRDLNQPLSPDRSDSRLGSESLSAKGASVVNVDNVHRLFRDAADQHRYREALGYGLQMAAQGTASAQDLRVIAQSYLALNDCPNAMVWSEKASEASRSGGQHADLLQPELMAGCPGAFHRSITPEHRERILRLLATVQQRAKIDQDNLPKLEAEAAASASGEPYVKLGQLFYGFGEYDQAIAAIERGLEKGSITHLDDAFICLGRSKVALKDFDGARSAFARLREIPTLSPKIAALWILYGDTLKEVR